MTDVQRCMKAFWRAMGCVAWMSPAEDKPGASALLVPQGAERVSPPPSSPLSVCPVMQEFANSQLLLVPTSEAETWAWVWCLGCIKPDWSTWALFCPPWWRWNEPLQKPVQTDSPQKKINLRNSAWLSQHFVRVLPNAKRQVLLPASSPENFHFILLQS